MSFLFQPSPALPSCHPAGLAHSPPPSTPVHFLQADFILDFRAGREGGEGDICPPGPLAFEAFCGLPAAPCSAGTPAPELCRPTPAHSQCRRFVFVRFIRRGVLPWSSPLHECSAELPPPHGAFLGHHLQPLLWLPHSEFGIFFFFRSQHGAWDSETRPSHAKCTEPSLCAGCAWSEGSVLVA